MRVLGLDPSLTGYGWAVHDTEASDRDRCVDRGRFSTKAKQFSDEISRYVHLRSLLSQKIAEIRPDAVGIEHPVHGEIYSAGMYGLFLFSLEAIRQERMDVVLLGPPQVKKWAKMFLERPSSWKMGKSDMVEAARAHAGGGRWDHNEADAYLVAVFASRFWEFFHGQIVEDDLTEYELKTFTHSRVITKGAKAGKPDVKGFIHRENDRFFMWSRE